MCFIVHPKHLARQIAKNPIRTFKVLRREHYSWGPVYSAYWQKWIYSFNHLYTLEIDSEMNNPLNPRSPYQTHFDVPGTIQLGFHSFEKSTRAFAERRDYLHSTFGEDDVVVECEIPKGAYYYYNPKEGEYVSTQIIILRHYPLYLSIRDTIVLPFKWLLKYW